MRWSQVLWVMVMSGTCANTLKIILVNDDGWATANIRAVYNHLKGAGHHVILSAPLENESGTGNLLRVPTSETTDSYGVFNSSMPGAPSVGFNTSNHCLNYLAGSPAASALYGIQVLAPIHFENSSIDLVVSGVNYGNNAGATFSISGTDGAAYTSLAVGVPAIAVSGATGTAKSYLDLGGPDDPANVYANLTALIVSQIANGSRVLPVDVGLNINFPSLSSSCRYPSSFQKSTITGKGRNQNVSTANVASLMNGSIVLKNGLHLPTESKKIMHFAIEALGNSSLESENEVIKHCLTSVSEFTVVGRNLSDI